MGLIPELERQDQVELGQTLHRFAEELYLICRSITGAGMRRETLARTGSHCRYMKYQRKPPFSTGPCPTSAIFEMPLLKIRKGTG
jgi:hypothetical protein